DVARIGRDEEGEIPDQVDPSCPRVCFEARALAEEEELAEPDLFDLLEEIAARPLQRRRRAVDQLLRPLEIGRATVILLLRPEHCVIVEPGGARVAELCEAGMQTRVRRAAEVLPCRLEQPALESPPGIEVDRRRRKPLARAVALAEEPVLDEPVGAD